MSEVPLSGPTHPTFEPVEREFFIENLQVRIHFIIVMIRWTGIAPWDFEFPFPGSLTFTFLSSYPHPEAYPNVSKWSERHLLRPPGALGLGLGPYDSPRGGGVFLCARYPCTESQQSQHL